jgi:rhamnosyl/mannosyltransferase
MAMKVLHIGKYYPPHFGGIERVNFDLVESLNKQGICADVLCFNDSSADLYENRNYKIFRAAHLFTLRSTPFSVSIFKILKRIHQNYDIIHLHLPNPIGAIALQLVNYKGKIVIHWHSDIIRQRVLRKLYSPFQKALLKRADRIIVTSPPYLEGSEDLREFTTKCVVIPIGINQPELPDENLLNELKRNYSNKKVIFSLGRLIYYKGFNYLIEAASELPDDYLILIGGTGEMYKELSKKIIKNGLTKKVILLGKIPSDQIAAYFELCVLYCLPSCERSEAFGIVQIEAMSHGKPVISTRIPYSGVPWINDHESTGLTVQPKNSKALADAIQRLLSDFETCEGYGYNAREKFRTEFTVEKMCGKTIDLYKSFLAK